MGFFPNFFKNNPFSNITLADDNDIDNFNIYSLAKDQNLISQNPDGQETNTSPSRTDFWDIRALDWYKTFPYQFVVLSPDNSFSVTNIIRTFGADLISANKGTPISDTAYYTLPIPPQAMTTKMITASQITPTIGGMVEETGSNVFWMINLVGTTGTGIGRSTDERVAAQGSDKMADLFRTRQRTTGATAGLFSGISKTLAKLSSVASLVGGLFPGITPGAGSGIEEEAPTLSGISEAVQGALLPSITYASSAVPRKSNGFREINELHRFLLVYSKLKEANPTTYFLKFRNYKTGQEWYCSVQDFVIQQNAQNPMLYKYNIQLKCWNLSNINASTRLDLASNRFGQGGDLQSVNIVSLKEANAGFKSLFHNYSIKGKIK